MYKCAEYPLKLKLKTLLMRKLLTFVAMLITGSMFAGGLVTNTNQSAMYTRLLSRNASTSIDAVYYNPAGLTWLSDGFHASINNQTIIQKRTILNNYAFLTGTPREYTGKVSAPIFPGVYLAYNTGNWSFSAGFNPIGGGGGAKYNNGLPSFEMGIADIKPLLASKSIPTSAYSADIYFEGSSVYFGYQANIAYNINDVLSIAAGVRLVSAKNTYNGHLNNITINPDYPAFGAMYTGGMVLARDFFTSGAATLNGLAAGATAFVTGLQPIINGGGGATPLANGTSVGLTSTQVAQIQQIIGAAGQNPSGLTIAQAQGILVAAAPVFTDNANSMTTNAGKTQDVSVDAEQSGTGYTPIISVNISPSEDLNISLRYEFQTKLKLITKVKEDKGGGIFVNGTETLADMPAMLSVGIDYKALDNLLVSGSLNYFFDKNVDYDGSKILNVNMIDKNFTELAFGAEYGLTDELRASAGWQGTYTGVNSAYQNDQRFSLNTNSFGAGIGYRISPMIDLNIGGQYTMYKEGTKSFTHDVVPPPFNSVTETYNKNTWIVAVGLDFSFGK